MTATTTALTMDMKTAPAKHWYMTPHGETQTWGARVYISLLLSAHHPSLGILKNILRKKTMQSQAMAFRISSGQTAYMQ